ncbi:MAG TPA: TolC family protein [Acidisarcina sp.]|nr:TolC family protein [Acidisarcina sp.]
MKHIAALLLLPLGLGAGCARYSYHAAPISPPALAQSLYSRSLDDPDLRLWMRQSADFQPSSWPLENWDLNALTLAAYYFNPDLDVARANVASAEAAIRTAAMKPNPLVSAGPGYESDPTSPFIMAFNFDLPIETAGKRGYRIANATHLSRASRLQLAETAWTVRSRVRSAFVDYLFAVQASAQLRRQVSLQGKYADQIERRFHAGEIALPEVTAARIDLTTLRQALRAAEGQMNVSHTALAASIGIPDSALATKSLQWPGIDAPPAPASLSSQAVREAAVLNRLDVRRALEQYEAAQSSLQLEVARQYPDINLGPGYSYQQGIHAIALNLSAVLPLRNHNEGPIAEAEAQRKAAGAYFLSIQSIVLAESDKALAQYAAAFATLQEASRSVAQLEEQQRAAERMLRSGETEQFTAIAAEVQTAAAERAHLDALHKAQLSIGLLEDALQRPIDPTSTPSLPTSAPR